MKDFFTSSRLSGLALLLAGIILLMGIITAETYYPHAYTTFQNEISDLGATRPPQSVSYQPSAMIFNVTMIVSGLLILGGAAGVVRRDSKKASSYALALLGIGVLGVGIFPGNYALAHPIFALTAFFFGGLAALLALDKVKSSFTFVTVLLGAITLTALVFNGVFTAELGPGGAERWVAYPVIIWLISYGSYIIGKSEGMSGRHDSQITNTNTNTNKTARAR